jgi:hypothetical protein
MPYLYVFQEREFRRLNEHVFKVGYTNRDVESRLKQYRKGTSHLLSAYVSDGKAAETFLRTTLESVHDIIHRRDLGIETYECDFAKIISLFSAAIAIHGATAPWTDESNDEVHEDSIVVQDTFVDSSTAVQEVPTIQDNYPIGELFDRFKYIPSLVTASFNGMFACDSVDNIWRHVKNCVLDRVLSAAVYNEAIQSELGIGEFVVSRRNLSDYRSLFGEKVKDPLFITYLDTTNADVFAFANGTVFDTNLRTIRDIQRDDFISKTVSWHYDTQVASENKADIINSLQGMFHDSTEYQLVLRFVSGLLSAKREINKVLVLVGSDKITGKFLRYLREFFGQYARSCDRFFSTTSSNLVSFSGLRLITLEQQECVSKWEDLMVRKLTAGPDVVIDTVSGHIPWTAGFIASVTEEGRASFFANAGKYADRLLPVSVCDYDFTDGCFGAMLDLLLDHKMSGDITDEDLPKQCRLVQDFVSENTKIVNEWLEKTVQKTNDTTNDVILISELYALYSGPHMARAEFKKIAIEWFGKKNMKLCPKSKVHGVDKRDFFRGCRRIVSSTSN